MAQTHTHNRQRLGINFANQFRPPFNGGEKQISLPRTLERRRVTPLTACGLLEAKARLATVRTRFL